jgi:urea transport system ATP-binding protein
MTATGNIVDVQNVTVSFDGFRALDGLTFSIQPSELRFLIGPNGAGKTTLLDIITGRTRPGAGRVLYDGGHDLKRWPEHRRVRRGIGRKFQTPTVFSSLTVYENVEAAISRTDGPARLLRSLTAAQRDRVRETIKTIGLESRAGERAGTLAHGEKQWLEIGMLLIQDPKLLLLDEPVAGMTRKERDRTGELVSEIAKERSVLVVEHDMEFVRSYARTVSVLHMGKLLTEGPVEQVQNDPQVIEVYLGRAPERVH